MSKITVIQVKSSIGTASLQRATLKSLGFRRSRRRVVHNDTRQIRGMVHKVKHLVVLKEDI